MRAAFVLCVFLAACTAALNNGMPKDDNFPDHWGAPPAAATCDGVPLPGGYGTGSSELRQWIAANMDSDQQAGKRSFPKSWGREPLVQTRDLQPLPLGYGQGSGTLARWIKEKATGEGTFHEEQ